MRSWWSHRIRPRGGSVHLSRRPDSEERDYGALTLSVRPPGRSTGRPSRRRRALFGGGRTVAVPPARPGRWLGHRRLRRRGVGAVGLGICWLPLVRIRLVPRG